MKTPFTRRVGMNICRLRNGRGWTQQALAGEAEVDLTTVQRWESGRVLPDALDLWKLTLALRVPMEQLYAGLPEEIAELERLHPRRLALVAIRG